MNLIDYIFIISLISSLIFFSISFYNFLTTPVLKKIYTKSTPLISVLIPARNEEENIENCISSIIKNDYKNLEIFVLNDNSTDNTLNILKNLKKNYKNFNFIDGKPLPKGWLGKNWACHQLSTVAKGEYYLFIDADVILKKDAISSLVANFDLNKYSAISIFSTQITKSLGEKITIPLINFILLSILPLKLSINTKNKNIVAANGQVFIFKKDAYLKIDGHNVVKNKIVEDVALAKNLKANGFKILTMLGGNLIYCRMYKDFFGGFKVLSKIIYRIFFGIYGSIFFILLFIITYILPYFFLFFKWDFLSIIILNIISLTLILKKSHNNIKYILFAPIMHLILILASINSIYVNLFNKISWKNRTYGNTK